MRFCARSAALLPVGRERVDTVDNEPEGITRRLREFFDSVLVVVGVAILSLLVLSVSRDEEEEEEYDDKGATTTLSLYQSV